MPEIMKWCTKQEFYPKSLCGLGVFLVKFAFKLSLKNMAEPVDLRIHPLVDANSQLADENHRLAH